MPRALQRVRQFFGALLPVIPKKEQAFAKATLSEAEYALFVQLPRHEQKHALRTAQTAMQLAKQEKQLVGSPLEPLLLKAALLHDIGKIKGQFSPLEKACFVLTQALCPPLYTYLVRKGETVSLSLFRNFYLHQHHTLIGATLLERAGSSDELVQLLRAYDSARTTPEIALARHLLKQADDAN